jgi:hypothetical protein
MARQESFDNTGNGIDDPFKYDCMWDLSSECEYNMYSCAMAEYISIFGWPISFFPAEVVNDIDDIITGDVLLKYGTQYRLKACYPEDFQQTTENFGEFGNITTGRSDIVVHPGTFLDIVHQKPKADDLVVFDINKVIYRINDVNDEVATYFQRLNLWTFKLSQYEFSYEESLPDVLPEGTEPTQYNKRIEEEADKVVIEDEQSPLFGDY